MTKIETYGKKTRFAVVLNKVKDLFKDKPPENFIPVGIGLEVDDWRDN